MVKVKKSVFLRKSRFAPRYKPPVEKPKSLRVFKTTAQMRGIAKDHLNILNKLIKSPLKGPSSRSWNRVFVIGMNKTGTTSLNQAFKDLGFTSVHDHPFDLENDCFSNGHYYVIYETLDKLVPNSKFILSVRDTKDWILSRLKHCQQSYNSNALFNSVFTVERIKEWIQQRNNAHSSILEYFKDRPNDLLIFDVCAGDGYSKLCPFLDVPICTKEFPHRNPRPFRPKVPPKVKQFLDTF